ncbi:MAG: T9SS type A sorting domain-containing protein [Bacteroidia bacterium]|nr:T9SS type A sorting domain-containing protein [Bacteroidia bacterium]
MSKPKDSRRQFLKNTSLAALALGLSPLTATAKQNAKQACEKTTSDYYGEGPFYTDNPPVLTNGKLASDQETGTKIRITGRVQNLDCSEFIPNTIVDVWHADDAGAYDNVGYNLRGQVTTNAQGFYIFETIKPGKYLNGSKYRPSHIHFKITPPGFATITTQLYFQGDTSIADDAAASITSGQFDATHRIITLTADSKGVLEGTWDIAVDGKGTMGASDLHLNKGIIYSANPNPFTESLNINYGVFNSSEVSLLAFDMQGKEVATLEKTTLSADKYNASWTPSSDLPNGHYFISLKINDLQVHYLKVMFERK